jgi:hypothetical protein
VNDQIQNGDQFFTVCSEGGGGLCALDVFARWCCLGVRRCSFLLSLFSLFRHETKLFKTKGLNMRHVLENVARIPKEGPRRLSVSFLVAPTNRTKGNLSISF